MDCDKCKNDSAREPVMVPLYAVEGNGFRRERTLRGTIILFCVALLLISLLVGVFGWFSYRLQTETLARLEAINQHWLDYLSEYDFSGESYEYSQDGRGLNIIGDNNGVDYSGVIDDGPESTENSETADPEGW